MVNCFKERDFSDILNAIVLIGKSATIDINEIKSARYSIHFTHVEKSRIKSKFTLVSNGMAERKD